MNIDMNDNEVLCFFNFRSPYAYVGIKKALELNITPKYAYGLLKLKKHRTSLSFIFIFI